MRQRIVSFSVFIFCALSFLSSPTTVIGDSSAAIRAEIDRFSAAVTKSDVNAAVVKVSAFGSAAVPVLIESLSHKSYLVRTGVIQALDKIDDPRMADALGEMLATIVVPPSSAYGPENLAIELLERRGADGVRGLVRALSTRDGYIKRKAAEALARSNDPNAVPGLISALPFHYAVVALGKLKDPKAVDALVTLLPEKAAIVSLGEIKDPRAVVPLLRIVRTTKNDTAEEALGVLRVPLFPRLYEIVADIPEDIDLGQQQEQFTDGLISLLVSADLHDTFLAEVAITRIGRMTEPSLVKALESSSNRHLRKAAAERLGKMPGQQVEKALVAALTDRDPLVVAYAARALGELKSELALAALKQKARKGTHLERRGAVWAIARIGSAAERTFLKELCSDQDEYVRRAAGCGAGDI